MAEFNLINFCPCLKHAVKKKPKVCDQNHHCSDPDCSANVAIFRNANVTNKYHLHNDNAPQFNANCNVISKSNAVPVTNYNAASNKYTDIPINTHMATSTSAAVSGHYVDAVTDSNCYCKLVGSSRQLFPSKTTEAPPVQCCHCDTSTGNLMNFNDNQNAGEESYPTTGKAENSIYQQLVLNRNIQVFLQVEQFSKQKPIILSRQQYNKVKKTIQNTICNKSSKEKRKKIADKVLSSEVSVGQIRRKQAADIIMHYDQQVQTQFAPCHKSSCREAFKRPMLASKRDYMSKPSHPTYTGDNRSISNYERYGISSDHGDQINLSDQGEYDLPKESIISRTDDDSQEYFIHGRSERDNKQDELHYRSSKQNNRTNTPHYTPPEQYQRHDTPHERSCSECFDKSSRSGRDRTNRDFPKDSWDSYRINHESPRINKKYHSSHGSHSKSRNMDSLTQTENYLLSTERQEISGTKNTEDKGCQKINEEPKKANKDYQKAKSIYPSQHKHIYRQNIDAFTETDIQLGQYDRPYNTFTKINRAHEITPTYNGECEYNHEHYTETEPTVTTKESQKVLTEQEEQQTDIEYENIENEEQGETKCISTTCSKDFNSNDDFKLQLNLSEELDNQKYDGDETETVMLFNARDRSNAATDCTDSTRKTMSSMEIHYTSVAYLNPIDLSTSDITMLSDSSVGHVNSFQTIFRGEDCCIKINDYHFDVIRIVSLYYIYVNSTHY